MLEVLLKTLNGRVTCAHPIVASVVDVFGRIGCLVETNTTIMHKQKFHATCAEVHTFVRVNPGVHDNKSVKHRDLAGLKIVESLFLGEVHIDWFVPLQNGTKCFVFSSRGGVKLFEFVVFSRIYSN